MFVSMSFKSCFVMPTLPVRRADANLQYTCSCSPKIPLLMIDLSYLRFKLVECFNHQCLFSNQQNKIVFQMCAHSVMLHTFSNFYFPKCTLLVCIINRNCEAEQQEFIKGNIDNYQGYLNFPKPY